MADLPGRVACLDPDLPMIVIIGQVAQFRGALTNGLQNGQAKLQA
jgi:hypothetical protein